MKKNKVFIVILFEVVLIFISLVFISNSLHSMFGFKYYDVFNLFYGIFVLLYLVVFMNKDLKDEKKSKKSYRRFEKRIIGKMRT